MRTEVDVFNGFGFTFEINFEAFIQEIQFLDS